VIFRINPGLEPDFALVLKRAFAVWLIFILVESMNGAFRQLVLEPRIGDLSARQVSVVTGSVLIVAVTYRFIRWIEAKTARQLTLVGIMWVVLTLVFEIGLGRFVLGYSWERILSDFNLTRGGFLGIGLSIMGLAPRIAHYLRKKMT
jgi:hypothetical protein